VRIAALLLLCACNGPGPRVACYSDPPPAAAARLADELRRDGWERVRVLLHPTLAGRVNVVARRGDVSLSALVEPGCDGSQARVAVVRGGDVPADEVGPGGPGKTRVSTF
jgi:hypothetical protein